MPKRLPLQQPVLVLLLTGLRMQKNHKNWLVSLWKLLKTFFLICVKNKLLYCSLSLLHQEEDDDYEPEERKKKKGKKRKARSEDKKGKKKKKKKKSDSGDVSVDKQILTKLLLAACVNILFTFKESDFGAGNAAAGGEQGEGAGEDSDYAASRKSRKSSSRKSLSHGPPPAQTQEPTTGMPTIEEVCSTFGLTDVHIDYTDADFQNLTTYKLFQQHVRPLLAKENPKVRFYQISKLSNDV